jgi:Mor family transcriptional regulator
LLDFFYEGIPLPEKPITEQRIPKSQRNDLIIADYEAGMTLDEIGKTFGISAQRVHQIILRWSPTQKGVIHE